MSCCYYSTLFKGMTLTFGVKQTFLSERCGTLFEWSILVSILACRPSLPCPLPWGSCWWSLFLPLSKPYDPFCLNPLEMSVTVPSSPRGSKLRTCMRLSSSCTSQCVGLVMFPPPCLVLGRPCLYIRVTKQWCSASQVELLSFWLSVLVGNMWEMEVEFEGSVHIVLPVCKAFLFVKGWEPEEFSTSKWPILI